VIARQSRHGQLTIITVPGSGDSVIVTAAAARLLVRRTAACGIGTSLAWFDPVTRSVTVAVPARHHALGVINVIPYPARGAESAPG